MANSKTTGNKAQESEQNHQAALQLAIGWWALALFMLGGLGLEALHLFKSSAYFEMAIRRELWVLAHAHGALLAIINIVAGLCIRGKVNQPRWPLWCLRLALVLMPAGFFLGGINPFESDPSLWIVMTPIGALFAIAAAFSLGRWLLRSS